ncbi:aminotransferase class I/II-fold pyridoxal phosphate-dependent enzyme [Methylomonas sp. SURF-2]|uniref:Aminotransferase n=1 Tax=Methylomonas subterranea TaxID=2952225 RepID=A0ABT1TLZ4_9GAMM|nr:aminotransferase class I/II-fold pyridoxal phosphate-dependent enzyme [Methylomonas sp. SURF-2]MCQ8105784.1 aminotransferase class I/II-fold pyridoxal phosphate-dependent enzyme [Methylomonas sp. SURF-2]
MNFPLAQRIAELQPSDIRLMSRECERRGGINLGQGLGDLPTPPLVRDGAIEAILAGHNTYTAPEGVLPLRLAIAGKLLRDNGLSVDPEREIVISSGTTGAFAATLTALLNPGDGIVLMEPYYGYHLNTILLNGLEPQFLTLRQPDFALDEAALRAVIRPYTRALVVCTPSNPSGKMFDADELALIGRVADEHDLLVISDEIYEYISYDGRSHISPATVDRLGKRTVSIMGFSKTFSITGWRLGYAVAEARLANAINLVNDLLYVCAPSPLQYGVAAGLQAPPEYFQHLRDDYQRKRDILCNGLHEAGLTPLVPQGAYYVLADIGHLGFADAKTAALAILEQTGVASIPGSSFYRGSEGERLLRFCFAKDDATLHEAVKRLRQLRA